MASQQVPLVGHIIPGLPTGRDRDKKLKPYEALLTIVMESVVGFVIVIVAFVLCPNRLASALLLRTP